MDNLFKEIKLQLLSSILDSAKFIKKTQGGRNISLTEVVRIIEHFDMNDIYNKEQVKALKQQLNDDHYAGRK